MWIHFIFKLLVKPVAWKPVLKLFLNISKFWLFCLFSHFQGESIFSLKVLFDVKYSVFYDAVISDHLHYSSDWLDKTTSDVNIDQSNQINRLVYVRWNVEFNLWCLGVPSVSVLCFYKKNGAFLYSLLAGKVLPSYICMSKEWQCYPPKGHSWSDATMTMRLSTVTTSGHPGGLCRNAPESLHTMQKSSLSSQEFSLLCCSPNPIMSHLCEAEVRLSLHPVALISNCRFILQ